MNSSKQNLFCLNRFVLIIRKILPLQTTIKSFDYCNNIWDMFDCFVGDMQPWKWHIVLLISRRWNFYYEQKSLLIYANSDKMKTKFNFSMHGNTEALKRAPVAITGFSRIFDTQHKYLRTHVLNHNAALL